MADKENTPLGNLLGFVGFFAGLAAGWQASDENVIAALIVGVVVAGIGAFLGNLAWRILVVLVAIAVAVVSFNLRQAAVEAVVAAVSAPSVERTGGGTSSGWQFCNSTNHSRISVAVSYFNGSAWENRGWYLVDKDQCHKVFSSVSPGNFYFFAKSGNVSWTGETKLCVEPEKRFAFSGTECPPGYVLRGFKKVELKSDAGYTTTFHD